MRLWIVVVRIVMISSSAAVLSTLITGSLIKESSEGDHHLEEDGEVLRIEEAGIGVVVVVDMVGGEVIEERKIIVEEGDIGMTEEGMDGEERTGTTDIGGEDGR